MGEQWHYTRNGESAGPVTTEELKQRMLTGQIRPDDLVWKMGMAEWLPAGKINGLLPAAPVATASAARPVPAMFASPAAVQPMAAEAAPIGYFSTTSGLPARTANTLKGYAPATGDCGDWPLSDQHMVHLKAAGAIRKKIRNCALLYKSLFALSLIGVVCIGISLLITLASGPRGGGARSMAIFGTIVAFLLGFTLLYYFCWRATMKCQRWAPLTMFIIFMLGIAFNLLGIVVASMSTRAGAEEMIGPIVGIILPAIFSVTSWRAYSAIPQFLSQPMWSQEVLVDVGL